MILSKYIGNDTEIPPPEYDGGKAYEIWQFAFYENSKIKSVIIPDFVTNIGDCAFAGCDGLANITISASVTSFGKYAFSNCTSLTRIEIPNSVKSIGDYAFYSCNLLESIYFAGSIEQW